MRRKELRIQRMCENHDQFFCEKNDVTFFPIFFVALPEELEIDCIVMIWVKYLIVIGANLM